MAVRTSLTRPTGLSRVAVASTRLVHPATKPVRATCGHVTRGDGRGTKEKGRPCGLAAGWGTTHPGEGACRKHGGNAVIKHGRYSSLPRPRLGEVLEERMQDEDPLNTDTEIALARAIIHVTLEEYETWREAVMTWYRKLLAQALAAGEPLPAPPEVPSIQTVYGMLMGLTKMVERRENALSNASVARRDLVRVLTELGSVVEKSVRKHVRDEEVIPAMLTEIATGWREVAIR